MALYIYESLTVSTICKTDIKWEGRPGVLEYLMCVVKAKGFDPIFVAIVYRPPHSPFRNFSTELMNAMDNYRHKIILGDFNADQLSNSPDAQYIRTLTDDNSLQHVNHGVTHVTKDSETWLDLCLIDASDTVISSSKSNKPLAAGHHLISVELAIKTTKSQAKKILSRPLHKLTDPTSVSAIKNLNLNNLATQEDNLHTVIAKFNRTFIIQVNHIAPIKSITVNTPKFAPWMTPELIQDEKHVVSLYRRFSRNRLAAYLDAYRVSRDNHSEKTKSARIQFYNDRLANYSGSAIWGELKGLDLVQSTQHKPLIIPIDELNQFFASHSTAPPDRPSIVDFVFNHTTTINSFRFTPVSTDKIIAVIKTIESNATGIDEISRKMILPVLHIIAEFLTIVSNWSFNESIFPDEWTRGLIIPVNKIANLVTAADHRPITLPPFLSKVQEKVVHDQLVKYLEDNALLDPYQCGFRWGHSTQTALLKLTNDIGYNMDTRKVTLLVLFDFSKAFDMVPHDILLQKLTGIGMSEEVVLWFKS